SPPRPSDAPPAASSSASTARLSRPPSTPTSSTDLAHPLRWPSPRDHSRHVAMAIVVVVARLGPTASIRLRETPSASALGNNCETCAPTFGVWTHALFVFCHDAALR